MCLPAGQNVGKDGLSWQDIATLSRAEEFRLVAPNLRPEDTALKGLFLCQSLRSGLGVHMSDAVDLHDLTSRAVGEPGLTVMLFLAGRAAISVGGRRHEVGAGQDAAGRPRPMAAVYSACEPDIFERRGFQGQHMRKVVVRVPAGWLSGAGLEGGAARLVDRLETEHGALLTLPASGDLVRLASQMLGDAGRAQGCCGLIQEARAVEMVARVFEAAAGDPAASAGLPVRADARLQAAREYMAAHLEDEMTLAEVARHACVSVSTLQRLFRDHLGLPVWEYLRRLRLEHARRFLERGEGPVTEAALRAGYASPANFATAFKREYGVSPSRVRG